MTLRQRILLTVMPLVVMLVAIGIAGVWLLHNLGQRSAAIIRENYISIQAMDAMSNALRSIELAHDQKNLIAFDDSLSAARQASRLELSNITVTGEREEAVELDSQLNRIAAARGSKSNLRPQMEAALMATDRIRRMNEDAMFVADTAARQTASRSSLSLFIAVVMAMALAAFAIHRLIRTIRRPMLELTDAARAISMGHYQQLVPVHSHDEIGQLAVTFNRMSAKLRAYRQADQQTLARTRQAAQAMLNAFPDPVVVLNRDSRVELANPAAIRLLGVPMDSETAWLAPPAIESILKEARLQNEPVIRDRFDAAINFRTATDEQLYLPCVYPVSTVAGESMGLALVLHDITRFRLLDQLKSDWVATVSHELKTPLTSIQLAVHVLLDESVGPLTSKQTELLLEARENSDRLFQLIEQLLAMAKLEDNRDAIKRESVNLAGLMSEIVAVHQPTIENAGLTIREDYQFESAHVLLDAIQWKTVIGNLLTNATRHTPVGGEISVTIHAENTMAVITVADTGIGIPVDDLPHIFERFFRVEGRDFTRGTGLGLAIVREIVEAHSGTIRVESQIDQGTTFTISLPMENH